MEKIGKADLGPYVVIAIEGRTFVMKWEEIVEQVNGDWLTRTPNQTEENIYYQDLKYASKQDRKCKT